VRGKVGRPRRRPQRVTADRGYDYDKYRRELRRRGIGSEIARRQTDHGSGLGRVRWVVERTISWIKGLRRMRVRYDRSGVSIDAWTTVAAAVICLQILMETNP